MIFKTSVGEKNSLSILYFRLVWEKRNEKPQDNKAKKKAIKIKKRIKPKRIMCNNKNHCLFPNAHTKLFIKTSIWFTFFCLYKINLNIFDFFMNDSRDTHNNIYAYCPIHWDIRFCSFDQIFCLWKRRKSSKKKKKSRRNLIYIKWSHTVRLFTFFFFNVLILAHFIVNLHVWIIFIQWIILYVYAKDYLHGFFFLYF